MPPINANLLWMIGGTFAALLIGTAIRLVALRNSAADIVKKRIGSLKVWWVLALLWSTAVLFGQIGAAVLLMIASFLALREYLRLIGSTREIGYAAIACLVFCGIAHYGLIVTGNSQIAKWFFPISALILFGAARSITCSSRKYIRITAGLFWGAMLMIYGLSHALLLFEVDSVTEPVVEPVVGSAGWFLFLILLTEMNDIMQAVVGRKFGKHRITPEISPNKSLEGLAGGIVSTVVLSVALAPYLTTLMLGVSMLHGVLLSVVAGVLISLVGFLGDINMSAIKRDAGVKDGSSLLPGMGGVIDRIDSMIFTGPVFYYFVLLVTQSRQTT